MDLLLIVAAAAAIVVGILTTVIASTRLARENRARSVARIEALQALAAPEPPRMEEPYAAPVRALASPQVLLESPGRSLFEAPLQPTPSRRWAWLVAAAVLMASSAGVFYLLQSTDVIARLTQRTSADAAQTAALSPLELLSLRYSTEGSGDFVVTGLVQNPPAGTPIRGMTAVVYVFDREGRYFASARAAVASAVLSPGGESPFVVKVPGVTGVSRYQVSFQREDGSAVAHVDRRGTLPRGSTGDAVGAAPAPTPVASAANR